MSIKCFVQEMLAKYSNNEVMLDAWIQWASNPTSKSAGFGLEENYSFIRSNLLQRYSISREDAEKYVNALKDENDKLRNSEYSIYDLQKEIIEQAESNRTWCRILKEKLEKSSVDAKRVAYLLITLKSRGFEINYSPQWFRFGLDSLDQFFAYYTAAYGKMYSNSIEDELFRIGVWNKLWYKPVKSSGRVQTVIAPLPKLEELGFNEADLVQKIDVKQLIEQLFSDRRFGELELIDEVSKTPFGFRKFNNEVPSVERMVSICGAYGNGVAISPFLLDQMRDILHSQKQERTRNFGQKIENSIVQLCKELWPECELTSNSKGEQYLWRLDSSVQPRLHIYLTLWLTEADLTRLFSDRPMNAIFIVLNQSIPSAKRILSNRIANFEYLELLFPAGDSFRHEKVIGERFGYSDKFIELVTKKSDTNQKPPVLTPPSVENSINENIVPSATPESQLPNPIISTMPRSSDSILIGSKNYEDQDRGLLGFTVNDGKKVELDMFVGKKQNEERAHTISVFGRPKYGKSYTLGVILEMALVPKAGIRSGPALPVVIFHYDKNTAYKPEFANAIYPTSVKQDAEFLEALGAKPEGVRDAVILVPPWRTKERTAEFSGIKVCPLTFATQELGLSEWKLLMGVPSSDTLYVNQIEQLLRELDKTGCFNLKRIHDGVENSSMSSQGKNLALQRLKVASEWVQENTKLQSQLKPGRLIILDIRDDMIDAEDAMRLCLICLGLFQRVQTEENLPMPKLVVLDEAHKYVQKEFANEIVTVVNQMRHTFTTVVIASQNPDSIPSDVMEKSSVVILHQITSPNQMKYVKKAVEGLSSVPDRAVASLKKGEAIIWAAESTDPRVSEKGVKVKIRPRFSRHV
jgi:hypothetical protein